MVRLSPIAVISRHCTLQSTPQDTLVEKSQQTAML